MGKYDDMLKEYRERQNKNEQQQDTQQASGSDPYASMLAEYRASKNATSQPAPNASVHPGGGTALGALTSALSKVAGQSDKYRQGVEQRREKNLSELNALAEAAPYVASAEEGAQNAARRRELTKSLEASDMILGNDPRYYDEATRAAGMLKGWGQRTGGAYLSAGATFGQLAEAQDKTGRILTDSAYSGYMTDPLAIEQMRQAVENGWRPESVGVFKTNKEMLDKADELLGKSEEQMQKVYNGAGKADRILTDVAMGALDLGSDAVLNTIMPGSGLAAMSARSFGQGTYEQRKEGGDLAKQFLGGAKSAAIEILTEKIGGPFENIYGKTLTGRAIKKFVGSFDNPIVKRGLALAASALSEGAEEFLSDVLNPLADRLLKLDDGKGKIFKDGWFEDAMYSALIGSILGLVGESVKVNNGQPMTAEQKEALKGQAIERGIEAIERAAEERSETPLEGQTEPAIAESPQEAAGSVLTSEGTEIAETPAEAPTQAPPVLNSEQEQTEAGATEQAPAEPSQAYAETRADQAEAETSAPKKATSLEKAVETMKEKIGYPASKKTLRDGLRGIAADLASGNRDQARQKARALAEKILNSEDASANDQSGYKELRGYLQDTKLQISEELMGDTADWPLWRKSMKGKLRLVKSGGLPIDVAYKELGQMFGEGMFPQSVTSQSEMVDRMLKALATFKGNSYTFADTLGSDYGRTLDELTRQLLEGAADKNGQTLSEEDLRAGNKNGSREQELSADREAAIESEIEIAGWDGDTVSREEAERIVDERFRIYGEYDIDKILEKPDGDREDLESWEEYDGEESLDSDNEGAEAAAGEEGKTKPEADDGRAGAGSEENLSADERERAPESGPAEDDRGGTGEVRGPGSPAPDGEVGEAEEAEPKKPGKQKIVKGGPAEGSYEELGEKYGTIEPGENPERESAVPKQIDERRKTGEAVRTIYEAKATPESRLEDIQQAVVDGKFAHVSVSNEALSKSAESKVKRDGWEKAVRDFAADVRAGKANEKLAAMGAVLLNNAANSGLDGKSYIDLCVDYNTLMHNMGRGLAAARILKTLSPEAKLYALQKTVSKMNEEMSAKAEKKAQKEQKKAERKKKTGADALAEAAEEGKKRKGGRKKAAEKKDADNVPVSMWAERAGEAVADRLQRKLESLGKEKKAKAKTVAQQAESDIKKVLQSYSHTKGKAINAEALENILNNPQFAADLYKSLQNSLQGKAGLSAKEIAGLGESWIQKPLADVLAEMSVKKEGIHIRESLVEDFLQAKTDEQRDKVMDSIKQNIADQLPSTFRDRFVALRYLNMLGNFKTQIRNLTGNTTMLATTMVKNHLIRGTFEGIAHALSGGKYEKNTSVLYSPKLYKEAMADFKNVRDEALGEKKYSDIGREYAKDIEEKRRIFKFEPLKPVAKAVGAVAPGAKKAANAVSKAVSLEGARLATNWAMEMGDQIFSSAAYADALAGWMQAHKVKSLSSMDAEMLERARAFAIKEAQEATFRDTNGFSSWASRIGRGENTPAAVKAIAEGVIPFRKTPANVLARAFEYSPLGTIGTIYNSIAQGAKGEFSGTDLVNNLSKNFTGTGLAFIGYLLAAGKKLKLRTKDEDDKLEQFHKDQGLQDFSIVLPGGISVTLDWNAPDSIPLFMGATLYQVLEDGGISGDDALKIFGQLTEPMMEMSMLSGVNDALELASSYDNSMGALPNLALNALASYLSQGLRNSLLAQGEQAWEKYRRTSYTDKSLPVPSAIQRKTSQLFSGIPGYDFQQQDYIDAWGRKQGQGNTGERILQSFFNPAYVGKNRSTPYDKELERLHKEGFTDVIPQSPARSKAVGGEKLTPEEYTAYATTAGQTKLYLIGDFLDSKEYRKMDDEERAAVIKDLYSYADYKASKRVARMRGDSYENKTWDKRETVFKTGVDPVDYLLGKRKADADGNGSLKQEEIFDWLWNDDTLTEKQKAAAWDANKGNSKTTWEEYKRKHGH